MSNVIPKHLDCISAKLREMGVEVEEDEDSVVGAPHAASPADKHQNPALSRFPHRHAAQLCAVLSTAQGTSVITEGVWDNRYKYVNELRKMGAQIQVDGKTAIVEGVDRLNRSPLWPPVTCGPARRWSSPGCARKGRPGWRTSSISSGVTRTWWASSGPWARTSSWWKRISPPLPCPNLLMRLAILASGSTGNCTLVSCGGKHLLIDAGISARRITAALRELGLAPEEIGAVLITHDHSDHIQGLRNFALNRKIPVFASCAATEAICRATGCPAVSLSALAPGRPLRLDGFGSLAFPRPMTPQAAWATGSPARTAQ